MAKSVSDKFTYKESPLGIGSMAEKDGTAIDSSGGKSGHEVKSWNMPKGDGTGNMKSESPDPGRAVPREDIGKLMPKERHCKEPL